MTHAQAREIMRTVEVTDAHESMVGWEPKTAPLEPFDVMLAGMIETNRLYEIPFKVLAVGRLLQLWEQTGHSEFWTLGDNTTKRIISKSRPSNQGENNNPSDETMKINPASTAAANTAERKASLAQLCDSDSYLPIITARLDESLAKKLNPRHMANTMALVAEMFLSSYGGIADAFEDKNGLEIVFKVKLAQEKDNVEIQFKPREVFKDSASLAIPNDDQEEFPFVKKSAPAGVPATPTGGPVVEAEVLALPAPAATLGLPLPQDGNDGEIQYQTKTPNAGRTPEQQKAWQQGYEGYIEGADCYAVNPYDEEDEHGVVLHDEFAAGWQARLDEVVIAHYVSIITGATKAKLPETLASVQRACAGKDEYSKVLARALVAEKDGKNRDWMILILESTAANPDV